MAKLDSHRPSTVAAMAATPPDWTDFGPSTGPTPNRSGGDFPVASLSGPKRQSAGVMVGAALMGAFVGANVWYWATAADLVDTQWLAIPLGAVIALACRFVAGRTDSGLRAGICVITYLLALGAVLTAFSYRSVLALYGEVASFSVLEESLTRSYLQETENLIAYGLGAAVCWSLSVALR